MPTPTTRAAICLSGLLTASMAALATQPAKAVLIYKNTFSTPTSITTPDYLAPLVSQTTPLTNGVLQTAVSNPSWPSWTGGYFANPTLNSTQLVLGNLTAHTHVDIQLTLGFLGSWDSSDGHGPPDYLKILVDGTPLLANLTTNNASGTIQNYGGGTVLGHIVNATTNYLGSDTVVDMATAAALLSIPHTLPSLTLEILGYGGGYTPNVTWPSGPNLPPMPVPPEIWDEGWGIDSLSITARVPGPLPVLGAASAFGFSRKLRKRISQSKGARLTREGAISQG
jgi:hypothetical protein